MANAENESFSLNMLELLLILSFDIKKPKHKAEISWNILDEVAAQKCTFAQFLSFETKDLTGQKIVN